MKAYQIFLLFFTTFLCTPFFLFAQNGSSLPVARTVVIEDVPSEEGYVVVFEKDTDEYSLSKKVDMEHVLGVTALTPALVFETEVSAVPVVTEGLAYVRIPTGSAIKALDLLTTSVERGVAQRTTDADRYPFAIAVENATTGNSVILAEINPERAQRLLQERKKEAVAAMATATATDVISEEQLESEKSVSSKATSSLVRMALAVVLALGALGFLLYSFRVTIAKAIVSIGRNPRARGSIMALSFGNIVFALILCAFILFVAIAVLVLPV